MKAFLLSAIVILSILAVVTGGITLLAPDAWATIDTWEEVSDFSWGLIAVLYTVLLLISVLIRVVIFAVIKNLTAPETRTFRESLQWTVHNIVPVILLGVFSYLAIQTGYVLLFFPGLAAAIYFYFSDYLLATENVRGFDAMVRSTEIVYNRWWSVVGRLLFVGLVYFVLGMLSIFAVLTLVAFMPLPDLANALFIVPSMLLAGAVFVSLMQCAVFVLFQSLHSTQHPQVFTESKKTNLRFWFKVMAIFGPVAVIILQTPGMMTDEVTNQNGSLQSQTEGGITLLEQLQSAFEQGEVYYFAAGNLSYEGVCDVAVATIPEENREQIQCNQTSDAWAIQGSDGSGMWCLDSEGYNKQVYLPLDERTTCLALPDATELETVAQPETGG